MVFAKLRQARQSRSGRAIAKLSSGQIAAAAIPFVSAPILGRIYSPQEYGVLGLYIAFAAIFAGASTLQFQNGVLAVRSTRESNAMAGLALMSSLGVSVIAAIVAVTIWLAFGSRPGFGSNLVWLLVLPLSVISSSIVLTGEVVLNRRQKYGALARLLVLSSGVTALTTIAFGLSGWTTAGVMAGYLSGEVVRTAGYIMLLRSLSFRPFALGMHGLIRLGKRHALFPRFSLPATLLSSLIIQMPALALGGFGTSALLGAFARAQRLVSMPFLLVGTAISHVFRQRASDDYRAGGSCRAIYKKTALLLAAIGFAPMCILIAFGPRIFEIFLGPDWTIAGEIAQILAPALYLRMIAAPLEAIFHFTGNQRTALRYNVVFLAMVLAGLLGPVLLAGDPMLIIWGFSTVSCLLYCLSFALTWRCATAPANR